MHFEELLVGNTALSSSSLTADRYIASNRFNVRNGADAKFEKRWADRKSRIAQLPGFRFFTLLRRIEDFGVDYAEDGNLGNYISLTVWEDKPAFDSWRTGDAFKEAHGGGGIMDFINLLSTALFILNGGPKPAFYDGLSPLSGKDVKKTEAPGGWRNINADGENLLPPDVFVAMNKYKIPKGKEIEFETSFTKGDKSLREVPGFQFSTVMRRDATKADDGYNYISMAVWEDRKHYEDWFKSNTLVEALSSSVASTRAYYEGKLAIFSEVGP